MPGNNPAQTSSSIYGDIKYLEQRIKQLELNLIAGTTPDPVQGVIGVQDHGVDLPARSKLEFVYEENTLPSGGDSGFVPSWATAQTIPTIRGGTSQQWAIPSSTDGTAHFYPLALSQKIDGGDDGDSWSLETQEVASIPGSGTRGNILVPPASQEGAFNVGVRAGGFFPQYTTDGLTANSSPPNGDWWLSVGLAIYANDGGWFQETAAFQAVYIKVAGGASPYIPSVSMSTLVPAVNRGGPTNTNEAGFAAVIIVEDAPAGTDLSQVRFNIAFGWGGWTVFASKAGYPDPNA